MSRNDITYWFPAVAACNARHPRTIIIDVGIPAVNLVEPSGGLDLAAYRDLIKGLAHAAERVGMPCFLRNGQTSAKHYWSQSCFLPDAETRTVQRHVREIAEFSVMADAFGSMAMVTSWAVRKLIFTRPIFHAFDGSMPVTHEMRAFVIDGEIACWHPYWPVAAIRLPSDAEWERRLRAMNATIEHETDFRDQLEIARRVANVLGGNWSVDLLHGADGLWYLTDMAVGENSYHWPTCPNAPTDMASFGDPDTAP